MKIRIFFFSIFLLFLFNGNADTISVKEDSLPVKKNSLGIELNAIAVASNHMFEGKRLLPLPMEMVYKRKMGKNRKAEYRVSVFSRVSKKDTLKYIMGKYDFPDTLPAYTYELNVASFIRKGKESEWRIAAGIEFPVFGEKDKLLAGVSGVLEWDDYWFYSAITRIYVDDSNNPNGVATGSGYYASHTRTRHFKSGIQSHLSFQANFGKHMGIYFIPMMMFCRNQMINHSFNNYAPNVQTESENTNYQFFFRISAGLHYRW